MLLASDYMKEGSQASSLEDIAVAFVNDYETFKNDFSDYELDGICKSAPKSFIILIESSPSELISELLPEEHIRIPVRITMYMTFNQKRNFIHKDIISDTTQFKQILEQAVREQSGMEEGQTFADAGFYINDGDFVLNDNIGITEDAVIVHFNPMRLLHTHWGRLLLN
jgi:hypothetical protein